MQKSSVSSTAGATGALFTDFYELTMAQGFWLEKMDAPAVFDMFFRRNPFGGGFSVFAGLGTLLCELEKFTFSDDDIAYLETLDVFHKDFLAYLRTFKFRGDMYAVAEGTLVFPNEPLLRIHANLIEAQIIEGLILNHINFQSLIATKSARVWLASRRGKIMEFGLRRAQGSNGAIAASRAAFIGGASGTSNTLAGKMFGIPVQGTMAHSWIMSFPSELAAFRKYAELYPEKTIFLIDTYDTIRSGIKNAIIAGGELVKKGCNFGVRLDSGDMQYLSEQVRAELDKAGFPQAQITVSNDLTEEIIESLVIDGAPINSWGVGTHMVTGGNEAAFPGVYKLAAHSAGVAHNGELMPVMKFSENPGKTTNPGIKNVFRLYDENGMALADILSLLDDGERAGIKEGEKNIFYHPAADYRQFSAIPAKAVPLLQKYLEGGKRINPPASGIEELKAARALFEHELSTFDLTYMRFLNPHIYKVSLTKSLKDLKLKFINARLEK
ncbi:MAG: nicotinate phosphoribosyltransferase [Treponemataceae bacterium]|nr:MAG: nicotinate phosphoribosyltransferase [Treponemataceae bacterium]